MYVLEGQLPVKQVVFMSMINNKRIRSVMVKQDYKANNIIKYLMQTITLPSHSQLKPLSISTIGVGAIRFHSAAVIDNILYASQGASISAWSIKEAKMLFKKQVTSSQVYQVRAHEDNLIVTAFDGQVVKLNKDLYIMAGSKLQAKDCYYAHKIGNKLICNSHISDTPHIQVIEVLDMDTLKVEMLHKGKLQYCHVFGDSFVAVERVEGVDHKMKELHVVRLDNKGQVVRVGMLDPSAKGVVTAQLVDSTLFLAHPGNKVSIANLETGSIKVIEVPQCSCFRPFDIDGKKGASFLSKNKTYFITTDGEVMQKTRKRSLDWCFYFEVIKSEAFDYSSLLAYNQNGLHFITEDKIDSQSIFQVSCCGLAANGKSIALGDLAGNVHFVNAQSGKVDSKFVGDGVRSLVWGKDGYLYIGTMQGMLMKMLESEDMAIPVHEFGDTVTCIRATDRGVWGGLTNGKLFFYSYEGSLQKCEQVHKAKHYADPAKAERFGSMKNKAEIWSIALSPNQKKIATASEDQSVAIVDANTLQVISLIEGHTLAVTSVAWQNTPLGEILVSCSDDNLVRFYDPITYQPILQLTSKAIPDWHTLTYLAIDGDKLAVGTQNGYLLVYHMGEKKFLYAEKIHLGGVEGLMFEKGRICSVSSDLTLSIMQV